MANYSATIQQDVMDELARIADVYFYGPGFPDYNINDDIYEIIAKSSFKPDIIVLGHTWLTDNERKNLDPHPALALREISIPKFGIINKEYVSLGRKLEYYKDNYFDLVFSHHHEVDKYSKATGIPFIFWPFGVNRQVFNAHNTYLDRGYDLAFSGRLQNPNEYAEQSDIRVRLQSELFYTIKDIPIKKRRKYSKYNIYWSGLPRRKFYIKTAYLLRKYRHLSLDDYQRLQFKTKIYINTLSPIGLVSTRYFENMASKCLVLCEESDIYKKIFNTDYVVQFKPDLSDFYEKYSYYIQHESKREKLVELAYEEVMAKHTWERRIAYMLDVISDFINNKRMKVYSN